MFKILLKKISQIELPGILFYWRKANAFKVLAARSPYFKEMFYSNVKENQNEVTIEADPVAFLQLLEIMYTGEISSWNEFLVCQTSAPINTISKLWEKCNSLLKLADKCDIRKITVNVLENYFFRSISCDQHGDGCGCGVKLIIALIYEMEGFQKKCPATKTSVANAMIAIKKIQPTLTLDLNHFLTLLRRT